MKWSTPLFKGSAGIRTTGVQLTPSVEFVMTMSFALQPDSKTQSLHAT